MSWMQKLYRTYEAIVDQKLADSKHPLTPIGHTLQTAHIEITLDGEGNFQHAQVMPPKTTIMLPVTEESENRTSGEAPHPFADKLQYVAKDYLDYGGEKKGYFEGYVSKLEIWCNSPFSHPKVRAVLNYVRKGNVIADLVENGVLPLSPTGKVLTKWEESSEAPAIFSVLPKTAGKIEFGAALVRWRVNIKGDVQSETWNDESIQQSWIDYLSHNEAQKGFCLVQGKETAIANMHPAKLRHTGDKAKLISSNDKDGYTFRGRVDKANDAASVSAEVSAKAHSALRWLISRQGIRNGDQVSVAWVLSGKEVPHPLNDIDPEEICVGLPTTSDGLKISFSQEAPETTETHEITPNYARNLGQQAAAVIKKKMRGFKAELQEHEMIALVMLDSATPGRMALTYYQEFLPKNYFEHLDAWVDDFSWYQRHSIEDTNGKKKAKRTEWLYMPPSPFAIAQTVYGKALSDSLKKQLYARLLPVIAGGKNVPMPYDLVQSSFEKACNPNGVEYWEWQRNIGVACALYKGWRARHHDPLIIKREFSMNLTTENASRDYLFGRLLAVLENIERRALMIAGENRATNAERYMQRFISNPLDTWLQLREKVQPYKDRLRNNRHIGFLRNREREETDIGAALDNLSQAGTSLKERLNGEFLLGYHSQQMAYRNQFNATKEDDSPEIETV